MVFFLTRLAIITRQSWLYKWSLYKRSKAFYGVGIMAVEIEKRKKVKIKSFGVGLVKIGFMRKMGEKIKSRRDRK